MTAQNDPRTWSDEDLDESRAFLDAAGFRDGEAYEAVAAELARRAEIRLTRGADVRYGTNPYGFTEDEIGQSHDAAWYESRQTEDQWLDEVGATDEPRNWSRNGYGFNA